MTSTERDLPEDKLREIIDGCEGVQGGPWKLDAFACYVWAPSEKGGDFPLMDELGEKGRVAEMRGWGYYTGRGHGALGLSPEEGRDRQKRTGEHIARLDPATVAAMASELLRSRDALASIRAERDAAVAALVWIRKIADANLEQDQKLRAQGARTLKRIADKCDEISPARAIAGEQKND